MKIYKITEASEYLVRNMRGHAMARPGKTKQLQVSVPKLVHDKLKEWAEITCGTSP